jgi:hypothetical protein
VFDSTLRRNGIEPRLGFCDSPEAHHVVLSKNFGFDRERRGKGADTVLRESFEQGAIVELTDDAGRNALTLEPALEHPSIGAAVGG